MYKSCTIKLPALTACLLLLAGLISANNSVAPRFYSPVQDGFTTQAEVGLPYAPDRILVKFREQSVTPTMRAIPFQRGAGPAGGKMNLDSIDALAMAYAVSSIERPYHSVKSSGHERERWFLYRFKGPAHMPTIARIFEADPNVEAVSLDWRAYPTAVPNDPMYAYQWGHNNTGQLLSYDWASYSHTGPSVGTPGFDSHAEEAWSKSQGFGSGLVTIAIIDTGVDISHPDLNLVAGYDFGDNDSNPDDNSRDAGHGTACAGVAAAIANNGLGVAGIAGGVRIMPCKVANRVGAMYFSAIQDALYWAADQGADVISMSLGAGISSDPATDAALRYAYNSGCLILAASGNENASTISYPAVHDVVMGIGAASPCGDRKRSSSNSGEVNPGVSTDPNGYTCDGERWWGSNYGSSTPDDRGAVDLIAPTILPTTDITGSGGYASGDYSMWFNGTSCATPYAAGVAALVISSNPTLTNAEVWARMTSTATDVVNVESGAGWDRYSGYGMVNAEAAVAGGIIAPPVADFYATPTSGAAPLSVAFVDASTGYPSSWYWDFGDGVSSDMQYEQYPFYTYDSPGNYTVSLTVTNAAGSDAETKSNYISVSEPPPSAYINPSGETTAIGSVQGSMAYLTVSDDLCEVIVEQAYKIRNKQTTALEHYWHFDLPSGNAVFHIAASRPLGAEGENFLIEYTTDNTSYIPLVTVDSDVRQTYSISLGQLSGAVTIRATDTVRRVGVLDYDELHVDWMVFEVQGVPPAAPIADFTSSTTSAVVGETIAFIDLSTGNPTSWSWDFGDGSDLSTEQNPSHAYNAIGTYTVSMTAKNALGENTLSKLGYITVNPLGQQPTSMHVASMVVYRTKAVPYYYGVCEILVFDDQGSPVDGATVSVSYDGPTVGTTSGVTQDGVVIVQSTGVKKPVGDWCFEVTGISHDSLTYEAGNDQYCENQ